MANHPFFSSSTVGRILWNYHADSKPHPQRANTLATSGEDGGVKEDKDSSKKDAGIFSSPECAQKHPIHRCDTFKS